MNYILLKNQVNVVMKIIYINKQEKNRKYNEMLKTKQKCVNLKQKRIQEKKRKNKNSVKVMQTIHYDENHIY